MTALVHWYCSLLQHKHNIIHRDLKAENIFYSGPKSVKIGDFGFSTISKTDQTLNTFCGSPPYAAPELFKDESYYGVLVDVWALGIMVYFMVTGSMPFRADTVAKLKKCILEGTYIIPSYISDSGQFLIRSILKPVPHDRFSIREIHHSDWLEGQDFPLELQPYNLTLGSDTSNLSPDEKEARGLLHDLGIEDSLFKSTGSHRDSRSSITGTYRILLHRVQKKNSGMDDSGVQNFTGTENSANNNRDRFQPSTKHESKFCVIL